jgi:hypothetical protein
MKHPKCEKCQGCTLHSECRTIKKGGCSCLPPDLEAAFRDVLNLGSDVPIVVR